MEVAKLLTDRNKSVFAFHRFRHVGNHSGEENTAAVAAQDPPGVLKERRWRRRRRRQRQRRRHNTVQRARGEDPDRPGDGRRGRRRR